MGLLSLFSSFIHDIQYVPFHAYDENLIFPCSDSHSPSKGNIFKDDVDKPLVIHGAPTFYSDTIWDNPLDRNIDYSLIETSSSHDYSSSNVCFLPSLDGSTIWDEPLDTNMDYSLMRYLWMIFWFLLLSINLFLYILLIFLL